MPPPSFSPRRVFADAPWITRLSRDAASDQRRSRIGRRNQRSVKSEHFYSSPEMNLGDVSRHGRNHHDTGDGRHDGKDTFVE